MPVLDSLFTSQVVLVATAAVVFYAAVTDFRTFTISNNLIVALALLFFCTLQFRAVGLKCHGTLASPL